MDTNLPILGYYPKNNEKFIDPMYVPYLSHALPIGGKDPKNSRGVTNVLNNQCFLPINTWKHTANWNFVHPDHLRRGWQWDYLNIEPDDPCPGGFEKNNNGTAKGMCSRIKEEEHDSSFFTDSEFRVKNQYPAGYTIHPNETRKLASLNRYDTGPSFQNYSNNPYTGEWVRYYDMKPNVNGTKYGTLPSRSSYLGI